MSEWLREALEAACVAHGVAAEAGEAGVRIQDGLVIDPRVLERVHPTGALQIQADFHIGSPRLVDLPFLDSYAGIGATPEAALHDAFGKFVRGSLHVLLESLTSHDCAAEQVEWEDWTGPSGAWRVCSGPLLMLATREGARIDGYPAFFASLADRGRASLPPGPHWMRIFLGAIDGAHVGGEVLVDGQPWEEGQRLLDAHPWTYPPGYASLRHLLVALPATA